MSQESSNCCTADTIMGLWNYFRLHNKVALNRYKPVEANSIGLENLRFNFANYQEMYEQIFENIFLTIICYDNATTMFIPKSSDTEGLRIVKLGSTFLIGKGKFTKESHAKLYASISEPPDITILDYGPFKVKYTLLTQEQADKESTRLKPKILPANDFPSFCKPSL
jgi:hypothetical protein